MKKKIIAAIAAVAVAALLVAITAFTQNHNINSDTVPENLNQRYTSMVQDGAIEVGFKVTHKPPSLLLAPRRISLISTAMEQPFHLKWMRQRTISMT